MIGLFAEICFTEMFFLLETQLYGRWDMFQPFGIIYKDILCKQCDTFFFIHTAHYSSFIIHHIFYMINFISCFKHNVLNFIYNSNLKLHCFR